MAGIWDAIRPCDGGIDLSEPDSDAALAVIAQQRLHRLRTDTLTSTGAQCLCLISGIDGNNSTFTTMVHTCQQFAFDILMCI